MDRRLGIANLNAPVEEGKTPASTRFTRSMDDGSNVSTRTTGPKADRVGVRGQLCMNSRPLERAFATTGLRIL